MHIKTMEHIINIGTVCKSMTEIAMNAGRIGYYPRLSYKISLLQHCDNFTSYEKGPCRVSRSWVPIATRVLFLLSIME